MEKMLKYDVIIIGGGISGINTALELSKTKDVLLLDERNYWGGRINTKNQPHYEIGAARYSDKHKLLKVLINKYHLHSAPLTQSLDYIHKKNKNIIEFFSDSHKSLNNYFKNLLKESKKYPKSVLKDITLFEFMEMSSMCSEESPQLIVNMFGYFSEIKMMNAYDALNTFKNDFVNVQYYILREGLSVLCKKMIEEAINNGCECRNKCFVTDVEKCGTGKNLFKVKTNVDDFYCSDVVFAIKGSQLRNFEILKDIHEYIESVHQSKLLRIYAKYPVRQNGVWFNNLRRTTTNSFIRQIIPINYESGLIMVSYTDGEDTSHFTNKHGKLLAETKIKEKIQTELNVLFKEQVPQPTYFKTHYWSVGAHHWKPGYDSDVISKKMLNPLKNVFICGEAFSQKQAWIEGALETSENVIDKLLKQK